MLWSSLKRNDLNYQKSAPNPHSGSTVLLPHYFSHHMKNNVMMLIVLWFYSVKVAKRKSSISTPIVNMEDLGQIKFVSCSILFQEYRTRASTLWSHHIYELSVRSTISIERVAFQQYTIKEMYFAVQGDILSIDWKHRLLQNHDYSLYITLVRVLLLHC